MSPSGKYVVVMWSDGKGTLVYDPTLKNKRLLMSAHAHSDFAFDAQGNEVLVYHATEDAQLTELGCPNPPSGSPIASARLSDGKKTILLGDCNSVDWKPKITGEMIGWGWWVPHFSGIASRRNRGWVLVSTYCSPGDAQQPFARAIFLLALDGSGTVKHVCHHHSDVALRGDEKNYFAEAHSTSSWDGSLIVFASCWGSPWTRYDCYIAGTTPIPVQPPVIPPPTVVPPTANKQILVRATALITELQTIIKQLSDQAK
jgi:hypothetical protein